MMRWGGDRRRQARPHRSGWDMSVIRDGTAVLVALWVILVIVLVVVPQ